MIPFSPPRIDQKSIDEVIDTLKSGWITTGPKTKRFEKELEAYTKSKRVFCCNANTNGMELFLRWLGIGEGDEVIVPAYTYCATANVVVHLGAKPIMADVKEDFTLNPDSVRKLVSSKTKAIIPVDIGGLPCDYSALFQIIDEAKAQFVPRHAIQEKLGRIALMVDAAHSIGARVNGSIHGSQADAMVYSFHAVKNLTTAEGGCIALNLPDHFNHDEIYQWLNTRSLHGQSKDALAKTKVGGWEYDIVDAGWKCNMTDLQAALGLVELGRYESETLPRRKKIVEAYHSAFAQKPWAICPITQDESRESSYHLYMLRVEGATREQRDRMIDLIFAKEVSVNVHYKPLPLLTAYSSRGFNIDDYPVTRSLWENEISLPVYFDLEDEQLQTVIDAVTSAVEEVLA